MSSSSHPPPDSELPSGTGADDPTRLMPGSAAGSSLPQQIGNYSIRRIIASGGMGTVYEALQEQPRRSVAVKVMRPGMFSEAGLHRFEYEAQLLARLRHPGIAQVYEAGTHREAGSEIPFFAMEYIPNAKAITEYAAEHRLSTRQKLELFAEVCDAVHHGHQRGIVHRDLKPGNILVDSAGHPKIIDFGVARATDSDMAAAAHQTEVGQMIGSLQYMSPEQFEADPNDIDTRSDVYALGIVLYELLSGKLPYEVHAARIHEAASLAREAEPAPLGELDRSFGGDLETIVRCALAKERERRYQSAFGLREDIRRFLSGAAIAARPPTLVYQLRVLARRNKAWIVAAAAVFVALVAGGITSTALYLQSRAAREEAELHAARSHMAFEFLGEMLAETAPRNFGEQPTIADLVAAVRERVDVVFAGEPETAADIHSTLGWASLTLEQLEQFEAHCSTALTLRRQSFGESDPRTLEALHDVALAQLIRGRNEQYIETMREIVALCTETLSPDDPQTLDARAGVAQGLELVGRYAEAKEVAQQVLDRHRSISGEEDRATIDSAVHLARVLMKLGDRDAASTAAQNAYHTALSHLGETDRTTEAARSSLAGCYLALGRIDDAAALYAQSVPGDAGIIKAYRGETEISALGPELLIMWEIWCPFSRRVVPRVEELYRRYQDSGLNVIGLTRVTRGSSDERVERFIRDNEIGFSMLKDNGKLWSYFEATGTPFVVLLVDGQVVWKGYTRTSAAISDPILREMMAAYQGGRL